MNMEFSDGMRAAMRLVQSNKLVEATRVIQGALSGAEQTTPPVEQALAIEGQVLNHRKAPDHSINRFDNYQRIRI